MPSTRTRSRIAVTLGATALFAAALLTACAPSGGPERPETDGEAVTNATYEQQYADWQRRFQSCLKDAGVEFPEPKDGELVTIDADDADVRAALSTCSTTVGPAPVDASLPSMAEINQQQLVFAKCMRDAGYAWEDPEPVSDDGAGMAGAKPIDPSTYDEADLNRCADEAGYGAQR